MLLYNAVHSIQQTGQIPNDPPQIRAKSTTTSNHPSTPPLPSRQYGNRTSTYIQPIIVKFARTSDKDCVIMSRKQLKRSTITMHEDLTRKNQQLLNRIKNDDRVANSWSFKGIIWCFLKTGQKLKVNITQSIDDALASHNRTGGSPPRDWRGPYTNYQRPRWYQPRGFTPRHPPPRAPHNRQAGPNTCNFQRPPPPVP